MKQFKLFTIVCCLLTSWLLSAQSPLEVEQYDKRLRLDIANPNISSHVPTGLIYDDIDGSAFSNLSDNYLRIADGPFGYQVQNENVIYSQLTKNALSFNHYDTPFDHLFLIGPPQRGYWGPRNPLDALPLEYDFKTFGHIFNVDITGRRMTELRDNDDTGALRLYRYSGGFVYHHTLTINAAGNPTWLHVSDRRTKENIRSTSNILSRVNKLQLKRYNYIGNDVETTGFIAQEVQKVFPDLVEEMEDGHLGVNYLGFSTLAIQAINEQQEIISDLEQRLAKVERHLAH